MRNVPQAIQVSNTNLDNRPLDAGELELLRRYLAKVGDGGVISSYTARRLLATVRARPSLKLIAGDAA